MEGFPSRSESTAASALLILSLMKYSISSSSSSYFIEDSSIKGTIDSKQDSSSPTESKSCCSTLTSDGSPEEAKSNRLSILALAAHLHDMKLKVVRRSRTKRYRSCSDRHKSLWSIPLFTNHQKTPPLRRTRSETAPSLSGESTTVVASLSGAAPTQHHHHRMLRIRSQDSLSRRCELIRRQQQQRQQSSSSSGRLRRRGEAIMKFLSIGCASEVKIRQVLGDNPDTSKALRMLLKLEEIKRSGAGGPKDPFIYTVKAIGASGTGSDVDSV